MYMSHTADIAMTKTHQYYGQPWKPMPHWYIQCVKVKFPAFCTSLLHYNKWPASHFVSHASTLQPTSESQCVLPVTIPPPQSLTLWLLAALHSVRVVKQLFVSTLSFEDFLILQILWQILYGNEKCLAIQQVYTSKNAIYSKRQNFLYAKHIKHFFVHGNVRWLHAYY